MCQFVMRCFFYISVHMLPCHVLNCLNTFALNQVTAVKAGREKNKQNRGIRANRERPYNCIEN